MEDSSLIRMAVSRGFLQESQLDGLRREQAVLADRGVNRSLWDLSCDQKLLSEAQEKELQDDLTAEARHGRVIAGYRVVSRLGKGGMGEVFLAVDADGRKVAIKLLHQSNSEEADPELRFHRESNTLMMLDSPYIVHGISAGTEHGRSYLVMEWVDGDTLKDRITANRLLDPSQALRVLVHASLGLRHAWRSGILHRDVKPGNVLLAPARDGIDELFCAKICDFGLARSFHLDATGETSNFHSRAGLVIGTPYYMSPEQFEGSEDLEQRADIFSLGATIFHAVVGRPIQTASDMPTLMMRRMNEEVDLDPLTGRGLSQKFIDLLAKMLKRQRSQRIQDWEWVLHECGRIDPDLVRPLLEHQPGFNLPVRAVVGVDPCRRFAEMTSSRIDYLSEGIDLKMRSIQAAAQNPLEVLALANLRRDLAHVRALAQNLEIMAQDRAIERTTIDLRVLSTKVAEELADLSGRMMVTLTVEGDGTAFGDQAFSRIALLNLVRNGILACRNGGSVKVRIRNNFLVVADEGHGIPPTILKSLFDPLSPTRIFGLGATSARTCQRRQGGDVRLLISNEHGTSFGVFWAV